MEECIEDRCEAEEDEEPVRPLPATCEDKCRSFGHAAFDACLESGRRPVMCRSYAGRLIQSCIENRCADDVVPEPRPEPRPEPSNCASRARAAHAQCLETGRDEDVCIEHAHRVHAACVTAETQDAETETEADADPVDANGPTACERRSRALFAQCIDNGASRLRCQALAHRFLDRCTSVESDEAVEETTEADDADAEVSRACAQRV
jgi:hypothetical protein